MHNIEFEYIFIKHIIIYVVQAYLCRIKKCENGKHKDCNAYIIEDIKDEKINKNKENVKY